VYLCDQKELHVLIAELIQFYSTSSDLNAY